MCKDTKHKTPNTKHIHISQPGQTGTKQVPIAQSIKSLNEAYWNGGIL